MFKVEPLVLCDLRSLRPHWCCLRYGEFPAQSMDDLLLLHLSSAAEVMSDFENTFGHDLHLYVVVSVEICALLRKMQSCLLRCQRGLGSERLTSMGQGTTEESYDFLCEGLQSGWCHDMAPWQALICTFNTFFCIWSLWCNVWEYL